MTGNVLYEFGCFTDSMVGPDSAVLLLRFLLKIIRSVRILDTIVCLWTLLWLFSPSWDAVKLTLVVIDPTNLGATIVVAQTLCLIIFNLSQTQKTCLSINGNKASVCVVLKYISCPNFNINLLTLSFMQVVLDSFRTG